MIEEKKVAETTEAKKVDKVKIMCSKHGDISQAAFYLKYSTYKANEEGQPIVVDNNNVLCISCLNDMYTEWQKEGKVGEIQVGISYTDDDKPTETTE